MSGDGMIVELRRLCEVATPAPWESVPVIEHSSWRILNGPPQKIQDVMLSRRAFTHAEDTEFMAAAREWLPKLLDMVASPLSAGEPDGMETTADERNGWNCELPTKLFPPESKGIWANRPLARLVRDLNRLLARVAHVEELAKCDRERAENCLAEIAAREVKARKEAEQRVEETVAHGLRQVADLTRRMGDDALAREAKAREEEREACAKWHDKQAAEYKISVDRADGRSRSRMQDYFNMHISSAAAIRARSEP